MKKKGKVNYMAVKPAAPPLPTAPAMLAMQHTTTRQQLTQEIGNVMQRLEEIQRQKSQTITVKQAHELSAFGKEKAQMLADSKIGSKFMEDKLAIDFFKKYDLKAAYNPVRLGYRMRDFFPFRMSEYMAWRRNVKFYAKYHDKALHVTMELKKGGKKMFWVNEIEDGFIYEQGQYVFDPECKYPITDTMGNVYYGYDFYEGFPLPVKHIFPIEHVKKSIENGLAGEEIAEVDYAFNPLTLLRFVLSDIIKKLYASDEILPTIKLVLYIVCAIGLLSLVSMVLNIIILVKVGAVAKLVTALQTGLQALSNALMGVK